jgi:hypothetical protein
VSQALLNTSRLVRYPTRAYKGWIPMPDLISMADFDEVSVFAGELKSSDTGIFSENLMVLPLRQALPSEAARAIIGREGLRPADASDLIAFSIRYPEVQRRSRIVALEAGPSRFIAYLFGNKQSRILAVGREHWIWSPEFNFLVAPLD